MQVLDWNRLGAGDIVFLYREENGNLVKSLNSIHHLVPTCTSFSRQTEGSCIETEDTFMQVTTVLRMLPEFMACELVWIEILRQSIQLRDYSNTSYENDAKTTTEPTNVPVCCNPKPRAQTGPSDHQQN